LIEAGGPRNAGGVELDADRGLAALYVSGRPTFMHLSDWCRLAAIGPEARWTVADSRGRKFPAIHHPAFGLMQAARLIVGAADWQEIGYRDGDPFNLIRGNLVVKDQSRFRRTLRRRELPPLPEPA